MKLTNPCKVHISKGRNLSIGSLFVAGLVFLGLSACHYYQLERKLDPADAEFYSQVRYIMTKEESRIYLDLPKNERDEFVEEFWKRRDPSPDTEENEFRMEYYDRVERASDIFISEGKAGWLTDRGRIYILFGPPTDRITETGGGDPINRCSELWYYGNFPVLFRDETCTGNFMLVSYDLTSLSEINLMYMHEFSRAQQAAGDTLIDQNEKINYDWDVKVMQPESGPIEGRVIVEVPYGKLWYKEDDAGLLVTSLQIQLELKNDRGATFWEFSRAYPVETTEEELGKRKNKVLIEIPLAITDDAFQLQSGLNKMYITVENLTGGDSLRKVREIKFDNPLIIFP